jgi:coenzyme F420-0:L-glutamate ligase/coenzyme F420-1:gamma-L-glutamate ligase
MSGSDLSLIAVRDLPMIQSGDNLGTLIEAAIVDGGGTLTAHDVIVVASTIVSKAEGRVRSLRQVVPSARAVELAERTRKDPRLVQLVIDESVAVSRAVPGVLIVRHRLGFVSANAGIDLSNVDGTSDSALLLPLDPDRSATMLREHLQGAFGVMPLGVVISDTHGRAFRQGNTNVAIGLSGVPSLVDERGRTDLFGRVLEATVVPFADQIASAAGLVTGEADEGIPVVIVRGLAFEPTTARASELNWPPESDLFA